MELSGLSEIIVLSSTMFGATLSTVMMITFLGAYTHGYKALVNINSFGEANIELIMLLVIFPIIIAGACIMFFKSLKSV